MPQPALIVIDIQNDYFPTGAYPLHDTEAVLERTAQAVRQAQAQGVQIHPLLRAAAPNAPVVVKGHADSVLNTTLQETLAARGVDTLWLCGMMTHNCVTHTALSPLAQGYTVRVLEDLCTTVDPMIHAIAISALRDRVEVVGSDSLGLRG